MISQASIEQLKSRLDIVTVVERYVELKKQGSTYKGLCPFHSEKTPSFIVTPSRGSYKCFGCGAGGDAIKFVMEQEHLNYPEAIEKLAEMVNFSLEYEKGGQHQQINRKPLEMINEFFKKNLLHHEESLRYLHHRGVFESSIEKFELGYAPGSQSTLHYIDEHFINRPEAIALGILGSEEGRTYPRLIERVTFPIHNPAGKLVGFGGRTLGNHPAKYLNSPETQLFKKSHLLYGYHLAKDSIFRHKEVVVTEGYMDVIMLHQAGFSHAVATLGTALTSDHVQMLKKGEPKVIVAYDGDSAGKNAAHKASRLLSSHTIPGGVVLFEGGMDPADMVKNQQFDGLKKLFAHPKPFIQFCLEETAKTYDLNDPIQKQKALQESQSFLKSLPPIIADDYLPMLASLLKISERHLQPPATTATQYKKREFNRPRHTSQTKNLHELSIIKTLVHEPGFIDLVLEYVDTQAFSYHQEELKLVIAGEMDDPRLALIMQDEGIKTQDESTLKRQLSLFLIEQYNEQLKEIKQSNADIAKKSLLIKDRIDKIARLKKGELVPYESI